MEVAFLNPNIEVEMLIKWSECIVELLLITKEFLEEYCILIEKLIYGNVDTSLLWLRLLPKYLVTECNLKRSKTNSYIFFKKYEKGKFELVISAHVVDVFMSGKPETLNNTKEKLRKISTSKSTGK